MSSIESVGVIFGLIASIVGFHWYVNRQIEKKLLAPDTLKKIALSIRPAVIFDSEGVTIDDQGALDLIEKLEVIPGEPNTQPDKIVVTPKRSLTNSPMLTVLGNWDKIPVATRGKGKVWEFTFEDDGSARLVLESHNPKPPRFKLEFII